MESVLHMFKQGYDKRDKWKLDEKDVHINLNKILGKGFNATVCAGTFNDPNISETTSSFNFLTKKSFLEVAIKIPKDFEKENVETFVRELDALITVESHPHIIKFFGWILYENTPVFVLERGTISLLEYSKSFREEKEKFPHKNMLSILWQISQALIYISSKMMIHRDIACRNVLLTDTNVAKLADFGLCCHCNEKFIYQATTNKRLPYKWLSIEAIVDNTFSEKSDVWAFGILSYEAYSFGAIPYSTLTCEETLEFLQSGSRLEKPAEAVKIVVNESE
uniref:Protein kinase domain-containing protein n=1 Tax=Panagrolaimus sp. PS1159 TaxID=55785 RepID=A0AC35FAA3_9BILA